ncbi:hypothetical protein AFGD_002767 [Aspergillus flavus]|nr:hypothetical protein AFGD_002767 [Aspergillus flavus]
MGSPAITVATVTILFSALSFIALCLRLFARYYIIQAVGLDDYLITIAALLSWAYTVCTVLSVLHGFKGDYLTLNLEELLSFFKGMWLSSLIYPASQGFTKVSLCWFYIRLGHVSLTRACYAMIGLVVAQTIAFVLAAAFHCPLSRWSHNPIHLLSCAKGIKAFTLSTGGLNILTDVLTFALPIPVLLKLQMPSKQKAYVIFIIALGLIACVASIVRLVYSTNLMQFPPDIVSISGTFYWTSIEMNVAIVASSIPSFKAIASRYLPRLVGYSSRENPMPLGSRNGNENPLPKPPRRPRHSLGASILYDGDRSSGLPTSSQERIHVPENQHTIHPDLNALAGDGVAVRVIPALKPRFFQLYPDAHLGKLRPNYIANEFPQNPIDPNDDNENVLFTYLDTALAAIESRDRGKSTIAYDENLPRMAYKA